MSIGGRGELPRMRSAAFSASMITGAKMFPFVTYRMAEASATHSRSTPCTAIVSGSMTEVSSTPMRQVQEGCSAVSASPATQASICSSVSTADPDRLHPLLAISVGRQIVEPDGRVDAGISRSNSHEATCVGVHGADVHL